MFNFKKWVQNKKNIVMKTAGLEEKQKATTRKMAVAMTILNRRESQIPVKTERRQEIYDYHRKLA